MKTKFDLVQSLYKDLVNICKKSKTIGYIPSRFMQMINDNGALETCRILIHKHDDIGYASGFEKLWEHNKLQWSMEYVVLQDKYKELFTDEERQICKKRLEEVGFDFSKQYED